MNRNSRQLASLIQAEGGYIRVLQKTVRNTMTVLVCDQDQINLKQFSQGVRLLKHEIVLSLWHQIYCSSHQRSARIAR